MRLRGTLLRGIGAVAGLAVLAGAAGWLWGQAADRPVAARLAQAVPTPPPTASVPCVQPGQPRPWVLLVLGQSNAGNHGAQDEPPAAGDGPPVTVFAAGGCYRVTDPLPGATGRHRSLWTRLPGALRQRGIERDVVFAVLAVDRSSAADWARPGGVLRQRMVALASALQAAGLPPDRVLWQQGEADAREGTSTAAYIRRAETVRQVLREAGTTAPIVLAQSTRCALVDGSAVRQALVLLRQRHADVEIGPDTDALDERWRVGCHLNWRGLAAAADQWADVLAPAMRP